MKIIQQTYRFELKPAKEQEIFLSKHFGCNRWVYNHFLNERKEEYKETGKSDNYHKQAKTLTQLKKEADTNFDTICLEDLNVKGMIQNPTLSKHIADASWGNFVRMVEYKADWNDKEVVKVGRFYPSSKTCSCGHINYNLTLYDRTWTCQVCHTTHDRDVLAASNILKEGLKIKSSGTGDNIPIVIGRATIRLRTHKGNKHVSMKPEAHQSLVGG